MEIAGLNIKFLPGVGPKRASLLEQELNICSYEDMLYHIPYKYIDRTRLYTIRELNAQLPYIQIKAKISRLTAVGAGKQKRMVATASDGTENWSSSGSKDTNTWIVKSYPIKNT